VKKRYYFLIVLKTIFLSRNILIFHLVVERKIVDIVEISCIGLFLKVIFGIIIITLPTFQGFRRGFKVFF